MVKKKDHTGKVYGNLKVLEETPERKHSRVVWKCQCLFCGNFKNVSSIQLKDDKCKTGCGCRREFGVFDDLTGQRFGKLSVVGRDGWTDDKKILWKCECDCGNDDFICTGYRLKSGQTKSCGCYRKEKNRLPKGEAAFRATYRRMKHEAEVLKNVEWSLNKKQVRQFMKMDCFYCGQKPAQGGDGTEKNRFNGVFLYNGLDRVDNTKGYFIGNVVPCCIHCNKAKGTRTYEEFKSWVNRLHDRFRHDVVSQDKFSQTVGHS